MLPFSPLQIHPIMTIRLLLATLFIYSASLIFASPNTISENLKIDQFGYLPNAQKIAVISHPINGFNNNESFAPSTGTNQYEVRRWSDDVVVFSGTITAWNNGNLHAQSGDEVWWFDFSNLTTPGSYYIYDVGNDVGSYQFEIGAAVYDNVLKQAFRTFYYQRCGTAKAAPYAETGWTDSPCHIGANQDTDCRLYSDQSAATSRDLSGGWHDAGDYNKYVNFTWKPMIDLLLAYEEKPSFWGDNMDIPESGNGIPDLLDEVKYELDWLLKMQEANGSVLSVVGTQNYASASPPSADSATRLYGPATTSATWTAAGIFALAAKVYGTIPELTAYANTLETAAISAWNWANVNPGIQFYNSGGILASGENERTDYEIFSRKMTAACFLYALTGQSVYQTFFDDNYDDMHLIQWGFIYAFEHTQQDMMLYYTKLFNATPSVVTAIENSYVGSMTGNDTYLSAVVNGTDAYRAYLIDNDYVWGSNSVKARQGMLMTNMLNYDLDSSNGIHYKNGALGFIHYLHGVNPISKTYLTNMNNHGADNSVAEMYHAWFEDGSILWDNVETSTYGPAPGILVGGVNPNYERDCCCYNHTNCGVPDCSSNPACSTTNLMPPLGQPIQKSYKEWNFGWPQNSWEITENSITYQGSYLRLLINVLETAPLSTSVSDIFASFSAKAIAHQEVRLDWSISDGNDIDYFEIERSTDKRAFVLVKKLEANNGSAYQLIDEQPEEGDNYYRLKIVKKDGNFTYSAICTVAILTADWMIVPNPAKDFIRLQSQTDDKVERLVISDLTGKVYRQCQANDLVNGNAIFIENLPMGVYVVTIETSGERYNLKFIKQEN